MSEFLNAVEYDTRFPLSLPFPLFYIFIPLSGDFVFFPFPCTHAPKLTRCNASACTHLSIYLHITWSIRVQGCYKTWKTWKSHRVFKKWLEILKSPLFQTLNNYFRIFRCYQKTKGKRLGKRKRKLEKKTNIRQIQFNWKRKRTWRHQRRNSWTN